MAGSIHYTSTLDATSASHILAYLNFDMVAKGVYGVFDGDGDVHGLPDAPGSDIIEKLFVDEFTSKGYEVTPMPLNRGSDYANFMDILGKPVRGLFTGAKPEQDPCYHLACDTYNNIDSTVLTVNAKVDHIFPFNVPETDEVHLGYSSCPFHSSDVTGHPRIQNRVGSSD